MRTRPPRRGDIAEFVYGQEDPSPCLSRKDVYSVSC